MTTTDDIFWIYERNSYFYGMCEDIKNGSRFCNSSDHPEDNQEQCFCIDRWIVRPIMIGYIWTPCIMGKKSYIKIGEECPICFEPIIHKKNAFLTQCGHSFHRGCLHLLCETNRLQNIWNARCPYCRSKDCYGDHRRYDCSRGGLDGLEEFWINKDYKSCHICIYSGDNGGKTHYYGMNKDCKRCQTYRQTGRN